MPRKKTYDSKMAAKNLGNVIKVFGETVSEILEDPALRKKAKEFSESIIDAAARVADSKIHDDEVRAKLRNAGKAAQILGKTIADDFKTPEKTQPRK